MSHINQAAISGNLTKDPELRHTAGGTAVCNLRLASNRSRKNQDGDGYVEEATFIDVVVWSGFGELIDSKFRKGDAITVTGRLSTSEWETQDGSKRSKIELIADQVDGPAMFKKKEEVSAKTEAAASTSSTPAGEAAQTTTDDDIPF